MKIFQCARDNFVIFCLKSVKIRRKKNFRINRNIFKDRDYKPRQAGRRTEKRRGSNEAEPETAVEIKSAKVTKSPLISDVRLGSGGEVKDGVRISPDKEKTKCPELSLHSKIGVICGDT